MYKLALYYYIIYAVLMAGISFYSFRLYRTRHYLVDNSNSTRVVLFIVLLLLTIFCATGDYWSYRAWYEDGSENLHFEPIWETVRLIIPWGFDLFKLILWGGCLILFTLMCKWQKSDLLIAYTLFALFYMTYFSYARATIAYMLIFFAYYILLRIKDDNFIRLPWLLCIAIVCILIGYKMHRSMPMLLSMLIVSLVLKPQKRMVIFLLFLFPIVSLLFNTILYPYIISSISEDRDMSRLATVYLYEDTRDLAAFLRILFSHLPILLLFAVSLFHIMKKKCSPFLVKKIAFTTFIIVYFSFIFYSLREGNGLALFYRTMNMSYPFMIMSIAYSMKNINRMYYLTLIVVGFKIMHMSLVIYQILVDPTYLYNQVFERYY